VAVQAMDDFMLINLVYQNRVFDSVKHNGGFALWGVVLLANDDVPHSASVGR